MLQPSYQRYPGSNAVAPLVAGGGSPFPTTWPLTQNPILLGSPKQGGTDGFLWQNTRSTGGSPGIAFGNGPSPTDANDNICVWDGLGFSLTKHFTEFTVHKVGGYTPPSSHEIEQLGLFTIGPNSAAGYEMDFGFNAGIQPVRWNGLLNDFTTLVFTILSGTGFNIADGDVVRTEWEVVATNPVITVYLNTVQQIQYTDTTPGRIVSGSPGQGFFARPGAGLDMTKYCNRGFNCGNF